MLIHRHLLFAKNLMKMRPLYSFASQEEKILKRSTEELPYLELTRDFLDPKEFYDLLVSKGINFFTGVPDSLLKDFCAYVTDNADPKNHIIAPNEGSALSLAAGYHMATNKIPLVYLQNSGFGNLINPLLSLAHPKVYAIPMILLMGWRGEPGKKDEPQHMVQGKVMNGMLTEMGFQFEVLPDYIEGATEALESAIYNAKMRKSPQVLIVKRQCFTNYSLKNKVKIDHPMTREMAVELVVGKLGSHDAVVGTTGFLSRELYEIREKRGMGHEKDFLCVGSMGHAAMIALGVALRKQSRKVWCLDGDGAALMNLGSFASVGSLKPKNFVHILFNNEAHDSVGAQPTVGGIIDFCKIAEACGYSKTFKVNESDNLEKTVQQLKTIDGPTFCEVLVKPGARKNLGRPKTSTIENKLLFMDFLDM